MKTTSSWCLFGLIILALLYYVIFNVFSGDTVTNAVWDFTTEVLDSEIEKILNYADDPYVSDNITVDKSGISDVFDTCPFKAPDPWDPSILQYVEVKYGFLTGCTENVSLQPVTEMKNAKIVIKKEHKEFSCKARCINYKNDKVYTTTGWKSIENEEFACDFVETSCKSSNATNRFIHTQISEQNSSVGTGVNPQKNPDVHLIVIDSVASTQIIRALPRTINFLMHGMAAVEFKKFNKIGSNSRPNAFAAFFGKTTEAVVKKVMDLPTVEADLKYKQFCGRYLDDVPYIPLEYMKAGYKTLGAEDYLQSLLNYPNCYGMRQKQFHHTYRQFHLRLSDDDELKNIHQGSSCRESRNNIMDYLTKFLNAYEGSSKFSLSWFIQLAHDDTHDLYRSDNDLYEFFAKNRPLFNNSFIFFFGDHGPRFGSEARTDFGKREANNPFLYVVTPKYLRQNTEIYSQLQRNSEELVTPHDLHSTFKDILYYQPSSSFSNTTFMRFDSNPRGSSLLRRFEEGVRRTCKTLPIPFIYCICQYRMEAVNNTRFKIKLGEVAARYLSFTLSSQGVGTKCEKIKLRNVIKVEKYALSNETTIHPAKFDAYNVVFQVASPAKGQFEIPIRRERDLLQIGGERFIRLDKYGNDGDCMVNDQLRPLCTCRNRH